MWQTVIALLATLRSSIRTRADLEAEILPLRHQVCGPRAGSDIAEAFVSSSETVPQLVNQLNDDPKFLC